ncbi:MAG: hypothetical protein ABIF77_11825 [bacterium]
MRSDQVLCSLLLSGLLLLGAAVGEATDEVGIFFDRDAEETCISASAMSNVTSYLILLDPSASGGVYGWQCELDCENGSILSVEYAGGQAINIAQVPDFIVGLGNPLPGGSAVELATFSVLVDGAGPVGLYILPSGSSSEETPIYADGNDVGVRLPMTPRTIGAESLVAGINYPNCMPEASTWGQVKLIYQ